MPRRGARSRPGGGGQPYLAEQFPGALFVTGLLIELDTRTARGVRINAGHPPPIRLRDGVLDQLRLPPDLPLGLSADTLFHLHRVAPRPGDLLRC